MTTENQLVPVGTTKKRGIKRTAQEWCDFGNAHLEEIGRRDVCWIVTGPEPADHKLVFREPPHISTHPYKHPMDRRGEPMNFEDADLLNHCLADAGAKFRYRPDGSRHEAGAE